MALIITQEECSADEQSYALPAETRKVSFYTDTTSAAIAFEGTTASGTNFDMVKDQLYTLEGRDLNGSTLYWTGTGTVFIQVETGLGS